MQRQTRWGGYLAALLLAGLTLSVFGALRDYGPESALRRFHQAAIDQDKTALQRVCKQDADDELVDGLAKHLRELTAVGARIRMGMVQRETRPDRVAGEIVQVPSVVIEVRYYTSRGVESIFWVLDHEPAGWAVNASETAQFTMKRLGVGRTG